MRHRSKWVSGAFCAAAVAARCSVLGTQTRTAHDGHRVDECRSAGGRRRMLRPVRAGKVRHDADDLDVAPEFETAREPSETEPLVARCAVPAHAGVHVEVHAGRATGTSGAGRDGAQVLEARAPRAGCPAAPRSRSRHPRGSASSTAERRFPPGAAASPRRASPHPGSSLRGRAPSGRSERHRARIRPPSLPP